MQLQQEQTQPEFLWCYNELRGEMRPGRGNLVKLQLYPKSIKVMIIVAHFKTHSLSPSYLRLCLLGCLAQLSLARRIDKCRSSHLRMLKIKETKAITDPHIVNYSHSLAFLTPASGCRILCSSAAE